MKLGVDVSNHQGHIDWSLVARSGIGLAMVKVTEGVDFVDPFGKVNLVQAGDYGLMVGAYHYALPSENSAFDEADHFTAHLQPRGGITLIALDLEDPAVELGEDLGVWVRDWLDRVEANTGFTARIYSNRYYLRDHHVANAMSFTPNKLWLAAWGSAEPISVPPWPDVDGWQFTSKAMWPGIGLVDLSLWDY